MKTTKAQFEVFKKAGEGWQQRLGLMDWEIYFMHGDCGEAYGQTCCSTNDRVATITLTKDSWDDLHPLNEDTLHQVALHEVLHVLFAPMYAAAEKRFASRDEIDSAEHSIIRHLERIISDTGR